MNKVLVTGCAGFIGSHLTERLLQQGNMVIGLDAYLSNYDRSVKQANMARFIHHPHFQFDSSPLQAEHWQTWLDQVQVVYHLAALPGVRSSWGPAFAEYVEHNLIATQMLLEAARTRPVQKIVVASSSSVYGTMKEGMTSEDAPYAPLSPYGVTKMAMEQLCQVYVEAFQLPIVILRYFTVYGPRQRPDMAFHRFFQHLLHSEELVIHGDGRQTRDFTYVSDAVEANLLAARHGKPGDVYNIGGNREISLLEVIEYMGELTGRKPAIRHAPAQPGDARRTAADISLARNQLGYEPAVDLHEGLRRQWQEIQERSRGRS